MSAEKNETPVAISTSTKLQFGIKELILILVSVFTAGGGYLTNKINMDNAIADLGRRVQKIEEVKPELLQYKMGELSNEIKSIKDDFKDTNEKIDKIYKYLLDK